MTVLINYSLTLNYSSCGDRQEGGVMVWGVRGEIQGNWYPQ